MATERSRRSGAATVETVPEEHWRAIVEHVARGPDHLVIVDDEWNILHANEAYRSSSSGSSSFLDGIAPDSRKALLEAAARDRLDGARIEVTRAVQAGTRVIRYIIGKSRGAWVLLGSDETDRLELLGQMTCIVEDLEASILGERSGEGPFLGVDEDPLTGLSGKAGFEKALAKFERRRSREGVSHAVILIDVDGFGGLNMVHGHATGDEVLRRVAAEIAANVRDGDVVARTDGDEFAVLASGVDLERALALAERLRRAVGGARMPRDVIRVEASVGVAAATAETEVDALASARDALARAKASGRNCTRGPE